MSKCSRKIGGDIWRQQTGEFVSEVERAISARGSAGGIRRADCAEREIAPAGAADSSPVRKHWVSVNTKSKPRQGRKNVSYLLQPPYSFHLQHQRSRAIHRRGN